MPLPPGLALNPLTGQISGVPTTPGTYSFTLRVRDSQGSQRDIDQTITITAYTPPSLSGTLAQFANRTVSYSSGLSVSGGIGPYVWSVASGTLPAGLSLNASTGAITGTPSDTSYTDRTIVLRVVDANSSSAQSTQTIRYADLLALSGTLQAAIQGTPYTGGFTRSGGHSPFVFEITSGTLPAGLTMNTTTGVISGTPTSIGSSLLTIRVTDASGASTSRSGTLTVNNSYVPIDITGSITSNSQNVSTTSSFSITPNYSGVAVTGGSGTITYSWARISGSAAISPGSPTSLATSFVGSVSPSSSVSATFRLTATDGTSSDTLDVVITVNNTYQTLGLSASLGRATRLFAYSNTPLVSGGAGPYSFAVISGALPAGLSINSGSGQITGTPSDTTYTDRAITIRVTDALGSIADASSTMIYRDAPSFTYTLPAAMRTRPYNTGPILSPGGHGFGTMAITSGSPPAGISLAPSTGTLLGTPTDTSYGTRTLNFQFTDAAGNVASQTGVSLQYADNLVIAGTYPAGSTGVAYSSSALSASGGFGGNSWTVSGGSLPAGLSLNPSTGALTGTPTAAGNFSFTVRVTDAQGFTADSAQSISIAAGMSVSVNSSTASGFRIIEPPAPATTFVATNPQTIVTASGGSPPYSYSWARISGSGAIFADSPTSASTAFSGAVPFGTTTATFRCTVTDSAMTTRTVDVNVDLNVFF